MRSLAFISTYCAAMQSSQQRPQSTISRSEWPQAWQKRQKPLRNTNCVTRGVRFGYHYARVAGLYAFAQGDVS
jgi:hypothetical protein